jgi:hypothetical protein
VQPIVRHIRLRNSDLSLSEGKTNRTGELSSRVHHPPRFSHDERGAAREEGRGEKRGGGGGGRDARGGQRGEAFVLCLVSCSCSSHCGRQREEGPQRMKREETWSSRMHCDGSFVRYCTVAVRSAANEARGPRGSRGCQHLVRCPPQPHSGRGKVSARARSCRRRAGWGGGGGRGGRGGDCESGGSWGWRRMFVVVGMEMILPIIKRDAVVWS